MQEASLGACPVVDYLEKVFYLDKLEICDFDILNRILKKKNFTKSRDET